MTTSNGPKAMRTRPSSTASSWPGSSRRFARRTRRHGQAEAQRGRAARAVGLVQAHDQRVPVLRALDRVEHEAVVLGRQPRHRRRGQRAPEDRLVEGPRVVDDAGVLPPARVRQHREGEGVAALVGVRVGPDGAAQQRHAERLAVGAEAVLGLRQQGDPEAVLGEVGEAVRGDLEARQVPGGVVVRRALGHPELHLERRGHAAHRDRDGDLQHAVPVVPVDLAVDLQAGRVRVEPDRLAQVAAAPSAGARRRPRPAAAPPR